ncbi:VPLPA-CTERM sorting domain-containing protein [uncultured Limimaricola sp.]|uniref:VPLPA-CTERM sorting domain-containing protein n=1 Tax=uncultured Limimaricola sp. TaxID=2211667 RepID=UPI0030F6F63E
MHAFNSLLLALPATILAGGAGAAVIYDDIPDVSIKLGSKASYNLDIDGNSSNDFTFRDASFLDFTSPLDSIDIEGESTNLLSSFLALGDVIDDTVVFNGTQVVATNKAYSHPFQAEVAPKSSFVGLQFASGSDKLFGWARFSRNSDANDVTATLFDIAYEDSGASLRAGDGLSVPAPVPLPASALLLACGLGALGFARRRRVQVAR